MTGRERDPADDRNKRLRNLSFQWASYHDLQLGMYCRDVMELLRERDALAARLEAAERENESERIFVAEMSGLINDMGDVPDPGLDDLPGMARVIRARLEAAEAALTAYAEAFGVWEANAGITLSREACAQWGSIARAEDAPDA